MIQSKVYPILDKIRASVQKHFRFATLDMVFILIFVNVFQKILGVENSIVGVIFTILMSSSMARDMTLAPLKHLFIQAIVLVMMAVAACMVNVLNPMLVLPINFIVIFIILYSFTYEYASHLYFPYILSYLFLIFISPITLDQLPKRVFGMLVGAICVIFYQYIMGYNRVVESAQDVLTEIIDEARQYVDNLLDGKPIKSDLEKMRHFLCELSRIVYERRKSALCVSDASFAMIDSGRGLEHLILLLCERKSLDAIKQRELLKKIAAQLNSFRMFVQRETDRLEPIEKSEYIALEDSLADEICDALIYIKQHLKRMTDRDRRTSYKKSMLSLSIRLKSALDISPVRVVYALRVAILLAGATVLIQVLHLPHGKWLLFTIASVSLPYADNVKSKGSQRFLATIIGGIFGGLFYIFIPSATGRTIVMMLSGYLSFYFSQYLGTFACSTVGALGGAIFMSAFGWKEVGSMVMIRIGYVSVGIAIAFFANYLIFPFKRSLATKQLWEKYKKITKLLTHMCKEEEVDTQLYYNLVIQSHLLEEKICQNASLEGWKGMKKRLEKCRMAVRSAHRKKQVVEIA